MSFSRIISVLTAAMLAVPAGLPTAAQAFSPAKPSAPSTLVEVAANCYAIGQALAAQKGGQLMQASESNRGGRTVCHIVIRIPGADGQRPRRAEFTVPAN
jgi:hypothetical protein